MTDTSQTLELDRAQHQRMEHVLSPAAIAEYWERGYWISPKLFDDDQIARLRAAHESCGRPGMTTRSPRSMA